MCAVAMAVGAAIWLAISQISGRSEAWDSPLYFSLGMSLACAASFVLGFLEPRWSWRWGVLPFAGQFVAMLATTGFGNLWPLGLAMFGILSMPAILTARLGAYVAMKRRASA